MAMKFAEEEIEKAIVYSVKKMHYEELKQELRKAVIEFIGGHDTFVSLSTNRLREKLWLTSTRF